VAIIFYCLWISTSLLVVHGVQTSLQSGGILFVETAGAYLMGRCFIRSPQQFHAMARLLFWIVAILFPFAVLEALTSSNVAMAFFSEFSPTHTVVIGDPRWGLRRVQSVFEHPILFGVSCGAILALVHLVLGEGLTVAQRWTASAMVFLAACLSLSSGPLTALLAQAFLIYWNWLLRDQDMRWRLLWVLVVAVYVLISIVSNQTVPEFLMTHFTFDQASAHYRVLIWNFGSESALNHPFFGVGFNRWDRPDWMPGSIDMFWLYHAVLFGIPAAALMMAGFLFMVFRIAFLKGLDELHLRYRTAYLIVMTGYFLVGWTVHFWNATFALFMFLLGSGSWLLDAASENSPARRLARGPRMAAADQASRAERQDRQRHPPRRPVRKTDRS
jgi:O-antigen ligase